MKVATRLSAAFGLLVIVLAGLLVYHVRTNRSVVLANYELAEISSRRYLTSTRQIAALNEMSETAGKLWVTRDAGYLELFEGAFETFDAGVRELTTDPHTPFEQEAVDSLAALWARFQPVGDSVRNGLLLREGPAVRVEPHLAALRVRTRRVTDASQAAIRDRLEASAAASLQAERVSWIVGAATLLLTLVVATLIVRSTSRGLRRLQEGTNQVALGNFEYRLPTEGGDEFAQLAGDFNTMIHRLGALEQVKRDFLSKVSHDLKTPLASMQETVRVMLDGVPGPLTDRQHRLLDLTGQSAERLSSMIAKILDLSAIEAGGMVLEKRWNDVASLVQPAVDTLNPGVPGAPRIEVDLPPDGLQIDCDRDRIVQVMVNLLENAIKFSPDDGVVRISARLVTRDDGPRLGSHDGRPNRGVGMSGAALIEVSDRGPGVRDEDKQRIFENFFQSGQSKGTAARGVGLGLAICREIVDLHGGVVCVRDNPGGGSIFAVVLPHARSGSLIVPEPAQDELEVSRA